MGSSQWVVSRARAEVQGLWVEVGGSALGPCDGSQLPGPRPKTKRERLGCTHAVRSSLAGHWGGAGEKHSQVRFQQAHNGARMAAGQQLTAQREPWGWTDAGGGRMPSRQGGTKNKAKVETLTTKQQQTTTQNKSANTNLKP